MNIRIYEKRPGAWHLDFKHEGARKRPYAGATKAEAERNAPKVIAEALRGPTPASAAPKRAAPSAVDGPTLREAYELALRTRERWIMAKDKATLEQTYAQLGLADDTPMATLTRDAVRKLREQWMAEPGKRRGTKLSASTINHRLSMLSVLLEVCDLPPHGVKHLSTKGNSRRRRFTDAEIEAAHAWCLAHAERKGALELADLIIVGIDTGAREGELLKLEPKDVGEDTVTFYETKNGRTRTIPLRPRAKAILHARRALAAAGGRRLFTLDADRITDLWTAMRAALGLADDHQFVFHLLRHESVQRMVDEGKNLLAIREWHGHESVTTTEGYSMVGLTALRAVANLPPSQGLRIVNG